MNRRFRAPVTEITPATSSNSSIQSKKRELDERSSKSGNLGENCIPFSRLLPSTLGVESRTELASTTRTLHRNVPSGDYPRRNAALHLDEGLRHELSCNLETEDSLEITPLENKPLAYRLENLKRPKSCDSVFYGALDCNKVKDLDKLNQEWLRKIVKPRPTPHDILYSSSGSDSSFSSNHDEAVDSSKFKILPTASLTRSGSSFSMAVDSKESSSDRKVFNQMYLEDKGVQEYMRALARHGDFKELKKTLALFRDLHNTFPAVRQASQSVYYDAEDTTRSSSVKYQLYQASILKSKKGKRALPRDDLLDTSVGSSFETCELWSIYGPKSQQDVTNNDRVANQSPLYRLSEGEEIRNNLSSVHPPIVSSQSGDRAHTTALIYRVHRSSKLERKITRKFFKRLGMKKAWAKETFDKFIDLLLGRSKVNVGGHHST